MTNYSIRVIRGGPRRARPPAARTTAAIIATASLALLAAACSASPSSTGSGGSPDAAGPATSSAVRYARCMRARGVPDYPDPDSSGQLPKITSGQQVGVSDPRLNAALAACQHSWPYQAPASTTARPASGPLLPTADPFYRWSGSLAQDAPGTILRTRTISVDEAGGPATPVKATQLLYVTTDQLGRRTVSVATVLQPPDKAASATTRLVSYQPAYDALGAQCDPSYTLQTGTQGELPLILRYIAAGDTVVTADYEGEDLAYGAGQQYGYETLDAIRAAEKRLGVPEVSTPVGMVGYSGGSVATEFASELARTYAPSLDIVGVAEGGIPVDLFHNLAYIDHPGSGWTGQIPAWLDGLARGFGISGLQQYLTPQGIAAVNADQTRCVGNFTGLTTEQLFKPQYQDITKVPVLARILDHLIMSRTGTPRAPLFTGVGMSDSIGDGVMVARDVQELAYIYCHRGVPVEFHLYQGLRHASAGLPFLEQAQAFLTQRFENLHFQNGCSDIGPGNSIAPVPVPAS